MTGFQGRPRPGPGQNVTRMLTHDLFAVANLWRCVEISRSYLWVGGGV